MAQQVFFSRIGILTILFALILFCGQSSFASCRDAMSGPFAAFKRVSERFVHSDTMKAEINRKAREFLGTDPESPLLRSYYANQSLEIFARSAAWGEGNRSLRPLQEIASFRSDFIGTGVLKSDTFETPQKSKAALDRAIQKTRDYLRYSKDVLKILLSVIRNRDEAIDDWGSLDLHIEDGIFGNRNITIHSRGSRLQHTRLEEFPFGPVVSSHLELLNPIEGVHFTLKMLHLDLAQRGPHKGSKGTFDLLESLNPGNRRSETYLMIDMLTQSGVDLLREIQKRVRFEERKAERLILLLEEMQASEVPDAHIWRLREELERNLE